MVTNNYSIICILSHPVLFEAILDYANYFTLLNLAQTTFKLRRIIEPRLAIKKRTETIYINNWCQSHRVDVLRFDQKALYMGGLGVTEIPAEIGHLSNLEYLYLFRNQLTELPPEIGYLSNLITLMVGHNQITHLPQTLVKLTKLRLLGLHDNQIAEIPAFLENKPDLRITPMFNPLKRKLTILTDESEEE